LSFEQIRSGNVRRLSRTRSASMSLQELSELSSGSISEVTSERRSSPSQRSAISVNPPRVVENFEDILVGSDQQYHQLPKRLICNAHSPSHKVLSPI
ncbi:3135_t:CDS:1, partial [Gigaspora margarita]